MPQNIYDLQLKQQDRLLAKFQELFSKPTHVNYMSKWEAILVALFFLLEGLLFNNLLIHITLVTIYVIKILKCQSNQSLQVFTIRWMIVCKILTSRSLWAFKQEITQENLRIDFLLICFQVIATVTKFRISNNKIIVITIILLFQVGLSIFHNQKIDDVILVCLIGVLTNIIFIYHRQQLHQQEHEQKLKEFDGEAMKLKRETEMSYKTIFIADQQQSRQEELLKKLRLLKYEKLLNKSEQIYYEEQVLQKQLSSPSRILTLRQLPEEDDKNSIEEIDETPSKRSPIRKIQRINSINDNFYYAKTAGHSIKQDEIKENENFLTLDEIDDLLKIVSGRKEHLWLPQFLRSNKNINSDQKEQFSPEAKSFILNHFTECEFNFQLSSNQTHIQEQYHIPNMNDNMMKDCDKNFNFDFFELNDQNKFINYCSFIFQKYNLNQVLKIKDNSIQIEFCHRIEQFYMQNPYHNSLHAMDVTNSALFFLENGLHITQFEQCCLIISSLSHDVGHPGLNNGFLVASQSKQALIYNDQSVLESYHASLLFHVLKDDKTNIIKNLNDVDYKGFRKYCLNLILDTDLQKHFPLLNKFKNFLALGSDSQQDEQNKLLVLSIAIKCADVGHGAKQLNLHKIWSRRIIEEFFLQGDLEQQVGIIVTPMCDRSQSVTKSQEGFLKAIVWPLFDAFSEYLKNDNFKKTCLDQINVNITYWQQQQQEEEQQSEKQQKCSFFIDTNYIHLPQQNTNTMINLNW
ncbi:unnamed protein product [Paramecium pentaurelia]|uniref:Phosphodiesterase n=1 Tax=Paramecium pentaurelia TaxID=43138 RepID=A0A8S1XIQ9_9CILI|nr:unnamed protein product [Paramecium pentaurelia]